MAPVFAINREAKWAWIADEWVVVGEMLDEAFNLDAEAIQGAMAAWLRVEMNRAMA